MEIDPQIKRRISEAVMEILSGVDIDQTTEYQVRSMAAERLQFDLSAEEHWRLVRNLVESFLIEGEDTADGPMEASPNVLEGTKQVAVAEVQEMKTPKEEEEDEVDCDRNFICQLSSNRHVAVQNSDGSKVVSICEYYLEGGKLVPKSKSHKGISLTTEQWSAFRESMPVIHEAIKTMESKIRCDQVGNHSGDLPKPVNNSVPQGLVPIKTIRLDEKNYYCWAQYMESFLNQLKVAYVLKDPCPIIALRPGASAEETAQGNAAVRKWVDDDYICHHNILNSFSDHLYDEYSQKNWSARELWEEVKLFCLSEQGTKRSLVKKYMEFQMVEGKSVVEQVQELNKIADSIAAAGMFINEMFHVSAIVSKLPSSWKGCRIRLMCEDHLPFWMLMDYLRNMEESRTKEEKNPPPLDDHVRTANQAVDNGMVDTEEMRGEPSNNVVEPVNHGKDGNLKPKPRFVPKCTPREKQGGRPGQKLNRNSVFGSRWGM